MTPPPCFISYQTGLENGGGGGRGFQEPAQFFASRLTRFRYPSASLPPWRYNFAKITARANVLHYNFATTYVCIRFTLPSCTCNFTVVFLVYSMLLQVLGFLFVGQCRTRTLILDGYWVPPY